MIRASFRDVWLTLYQTPDESISEFTRLVARDPEGVTERLDLLLQHRERVSAQLDQLTQSLAVIDQKIADYSFRARKGRST